MIDEHRMEIDSVALQSLLQYEIISQLVEEQQECLEDECDATGSEILALHESDECEEQGKD